jgi:hypothetical protein
MVAIYFSGNIMNNEFVQIKRILHDLKSEYAILSCGDEFDPNLPITERDIVSEIYCRLKFHFLKTELSVHTEIRPVPSVSSEPEELKRLPRIDVAILFGDSWLNEAIKLQNKYKKGEFEARFSSVPVESFHTAIEVKIQSHPADSIKDINTLCGIQKNNKNCNCFLVLLNARGKKRDHLKITEYANQKQINFVEYTNIKI